jgi:hypothetical protein
MINSILKSSAALAGAAALTACAYPVVESDFGDSVRHMISSQTYVSGPVDPTPVSSGDGQRIGWVLDALRSDVSRGDDAEQPVTVQFGAGVPQTQ